jgi:hypothetical protein
MSKIIAYLRSLLAEEPAVVAWSINGGLAMLIAYAFHWNHTWQAAAATIITALATGMSALLAKPRHIQVVLGALTTILTAAATFGYHMTAHTEAIVLSVASVVLAFLFRQNLSPVASPQRKEA